LKDLWILGDGTNGIPKMKKLFRLCVALLISIEWAVSLGCPLSFGAESPGSKDDAIGKIISAVTTCWVMYEGSNTRMSTRSGEMIRNGATVDVAPGHYAVLSLRPERNKDLIYIHGGTKLTVRKISDTKTRIDFPQGKIIAFFDNYSPYYEIFTPDMAVQGPSGCFQMQNNAGIGTISVYDGALRVYGVVTGGRLSLNNSVLRQNQWATVSSLSIQANQAQPIPVEEYQNLARIVKESVSSEAERMSRLNQMFRGGSAPTAEKDTVSENVNVSREERVFLPDTDTLSKPGVDLKKLIEISDAQNKDSKTDR
jgi:hypothetical protein